MNRRTLIAALSSAAAWPLASHAQQSDKIPRIGILWHAGNEQEEAIYLGALRQGLADLGYVEGKNIVLENRFPAEQPDRFPILAQELAALHPDVFVAVTVLATNAAQQATKTIPIVFIIYPGITQTKLVSSLAHPGGNITGLTGDAGDLTAKRIEVLLDCVGKISRMALLVGPSNFSRDLTVRRTKEVAADLNISLDVFEMLSSHDVDTAFSRMAEGRPDVLYVPPGPAPYVERVRIAALAVRNRLPTMFGTREQVEAGGLLSYGPSLRGEFYRAAKYIDKILKGEKPGDIPIEQPTKFELVINLKTAKAIGVEIPPAFLLRADAIIE